MKKELFIILLLLVGCTKPELPTPEVLTIDNIFNASESKVMNGQPIHFSLPSSGTYILTLIDKSTGQIISRERFNGKTGENVKKIYTNSLQISYLYLVLEDTNKNQLGKTTIITK